MKYTPEFYAKVIQFTKELGGKMTSRQLLDKFGEEFNIKTHASASAEVRRMGFAYVGSAPHNEMRIFDKLSRIQIAYRIANVKIPDCMTFRDPGDKRTNNGSGGSGDGQTTTLVIGDYSHDVNQAIHDVTPVKHLNLKERLQARGIRKPWQGDTVSFRIYRQNKCHEMPIEMYQVSAGHARKEGLHFESTRLIFNINRFPISLAFEIQTEFNVTFQTEFNVTFDTNDIKNGPWWMREFSFKNENEESKIEIMTAINEWWANRHYSRAA